MHRLEGIGILTGDGEDAGLGHIVAGGELDLGQAAAAAAALGDAHAHHHLVPVPLGEDPGLAPALQLHVVRARPRHVAAGRRSARLASNQRVISNGGLISFNWIQSIQLGRRCRRPDVMEGMRSGLGRHIPNLLGTDE